MRKNSDGSSISEVKDAGESISYKDAQNIIVKLTVIMKIETQFNERVLHKKKK